MAQTNQTMERCPTLENHHAFTAITWNIDTFHNKEQELNDLLYEHSPDVVLLQETGWKAPEDVPKFPHRITIYDNRKHQRGGGTAILIRDSIPVSRFDLPPLESCEATAVLLNMSHPIIIVSVYIKTSKLKQNDLNILMHLQYPTIVAGDINAKHPQFYGHLTNTNGNMLLKAMEEIDLLKIHAPEEPTHVHYCGVYPPSILDYFITNFSAPLAPVVIEHGTSDHMPVKVTVNHLEVQQSEANNPVSVYYNWEGYKKDILSIQWNKEIPNDLTQAEPEKALNVFISIIQTTMFNNSNVTVHKPTAPKKLPKFARELRERVKRTRRLYQAAKVHLHELRHQQRKLRRWVRRYRQDKKFSNFNRIKSGKASVWQMLRKAKGPKETAYAPMLQPNGEYATTTKAKATLFAATYAKRMEPHHPNTMPEHLQEAVQDHNDEVKANPQPKPTIKPFTMAETAEIIKNSKLRKAPGLDGVKNEALKHLPQIPIRKLTAIFNSCMEVSLFPARLKAACIAVIPKTGKDLTDPSNYRPVSLLSTIGKTYEGLILKRLEQECYAKKVLPNIQFGFRREHSTVLQLIRLMDFATIHANEKHYTLLAALDVQAAFDKVPHDALLF